VLLTVILVGSRLERREDGPLLQLARLARIVAALGRCGGPRGMTRAATPPCPAGLRAAGGAQARNVPRRPGRRPAGVAPTSPSAIPLRRLAHERVVSWARRAPRALEVSRGSCHTSDNTCCRRREFDGFRWSGEDRPRLTGHQESGNTCLQFQVMLYTGRSAGTVLPGRAIAVAALVVLAGRLPGHPEPGGNVRPSDTQGDSVVDQNGEFGLGFQLHGPSALDPF
jgi:hypothetical protein